MFKRLDPRDINVTPFKAYKEFTVTNTDSGSGVYGFRAISSSAHNFNPDTAPKQLLILLVFIRCQVGL